MPPSWVPIKPGTQIRLRSNPKVVFSIPTRKINMGPMKSQTPDKVTADGMHQMLKIAGLDCPETQPSALQPIVTDVENVLKQNQGNASAFLYDTVEYDSLYKLHVPTFLSKRSRGLLAATDSSGEKGEWTPSPTAQGYATDLSTINAHFDDLIDNYPGFNGIGHKAPQHKKSQNVSNTDAISKLFIDLAITASGEIVTGINEATMSTTLSRAIKPSLNPDLADYDKPDNKLIFIVFNFNETTEEADGLGFIYLQWRLQIVNYKHKSKDGGDTHETTITMDAQSAVYSEVTSLGEQVAWCKNRNASFSRMLRGIPPKNEFKVFTSLPSLANEDTWNASLFLDSSSTSQTLAALVFYGADLACLGNLDNKASKANSTYSISTTSGFTFTMTEKIGISTTAEFDVIFAKASVTINFELSLSEQWNTSTTETIQFTVPGQSQAFVYKGYVKTKYIYYDAKSGQYSWGDDGKFYSNYLVTSEKVLSGDPIYS